MSIQVIGLTIFAALAAVAGAVALGMRDLCASRPPQRDALAKPVRLRRIVRAAKGPARGPVDAFDRWFQRLLRETGLSAMPTEAALLLVFFGVLVGGAMFIWNEHPVAAVVGMLLGMVAALSYYLVRRPTRPDAPGAIADGPGHAGADHAVGHEPGSGHRTGRAPVCRNPWPRSSVSAPRNWRWGWA